MQKREILEEFRSFRTSKRQKQRRKQRSEQETNKEATKEEILILRIVYARKT